MQSKCALTAVVLSGGASRRMGREKALLQLPDGRSALQAVVGAAQAVADPVLLSVRSRAEGARLLATLQVPTSDLLVDSVPGAGPLSALADALQAVSTPLLLALAIDTPLVRPMLLRLLAAALMPSGCVQHEGAKSERIGSAHLIASSGAGMQHTPTAGGDQARGTPMGAGATHHYGLALPVVGGVAQPLPACYAASLAPLAARLVREGATSLRALHTHAEARPCLLDETTLRRADPDLRSFIGANTPEEWARLLAYQSGHGQ